MRKSISASIWRPLVLALCASATLTSGIAHEAHKMECTETRVNAMKADIQSMADGDAKTAAMKEVQMASALVALGVIFAAGAIAIYAVAADIPHIQPLYWLLETARERLIAMRAADIEVPGDLNERIVHLRPVDITRH